MQKIGKSVKKIFCGKIHQSWYVVAMSVGVIAGTIVALVWRVDYFAAGMWIAAVVAVLVLCYVWPRTIFIVLAVAAGMILALNRSSQELAGEDYIKQLYNKEVVVSGTIDGDPETDEKGTKFKLRDLAFGGEMQNGEKDVGKNANDGKNAENASAASDRGAETNEARTGQATKGNIYISTSKNESLARGDQVQLSGKLTEGFGTYAGFLYKPKIVHWARPSPGDPALMVRNWFSERIRRLIPEPEVNLGLSYLLGMKTGLPDELNENLRMVGLVHMVVASGAHLSILVEVARKLFAKISRLVSVGTSVGFVLFFMALVGWTPSIMRAGMMTSAKAIAGYSGRKFAPWRIILLVAAATLLINPMFLTNLGWLMSFASFAGIMIVGPKLTQFFYGNRKPKFIASTVITTLAATALTLPITLYYFGVVSGISVVANLLILPTLPYVMGLVFLTGVVSGVPGVETAVSFVATKMLDFHIGVVEFFAKMKSFTVEIETEQNWVWGLYLLVLVPLVVGWGNVLASNARRKILPFGAKSDKI